MLLTPTLALLSIIFNFCALLQVTSNWNGLSSRRWHTLDHAIYALEEVTATVYENCLDIVAPPPLVSSPVYLSPIRRAEWVYRSSAVRILDLVDGFNGVKTVSNVGLPPMLPPSSPEPMDPVMSASIPPPTPIPQIHLATLEEVLTYNHSTPSVAISSATRFLRLTGLSCLVYTLLFVWLKNRHHRRPTPASKPVLTCDVNCEVPGEDFHSINTATSIPSYPGSDLDPLKSSGSPNHLHNSYVYEPRNFPIVITDPDGQTLFKADIKLSSKRVITESSGTTSTVSFSIDVVASSENPTASEWYVPAREDDGTSYKAEDLLFLLLVRGSSDRASFDESQDSSSEMRTRRADAVAFDQDISPLGSPMCDVAVPVHYRGFSAFETALINSGTKKRMDKSHKKDCSHRDRARPSIRPKDVGMGWLRDVYNCGNNHLVGCWCDVWIAENAADQHHPHPDVLSQIFRECDAITECDSDTHSGEGGSGVDMHARTVSPGSSVRSNLSPTGTFDPAEPRPSARSDPSFSDGKEPAGLDSTVALMSPFGFASSELPLRRRSSGISTPEEYFDGTLGEQSMSLDDVEPGFAGKFADVNRFSIGSRSPPSPAVPARASSLMDALRPILANYTISSPSMEEATLIPPSLASGRLESSPLEYSPASVRAHSPVKSTVSPEYDEWVGGSAQVDEPPLEAELHVLMSQLGAPSTPPPRSRRRFR